jgi:hypothetical protein
MGTTEFKYLAMMVLVLAGLIGAYDFVVQGFYNPLVWAFNGRFAPLFWTSVFGILIWALWTGASGRDGSDIQ